MPKKATVNPEMCIGCGLCVGSAPSVFTLDEEGKAVGAEIPAGDESAVEEAVASCPVGAIAAE